MPRDPRLPWTQREIDIVSDSSFSVHEVASQLPGRTYQAVIDYRRHNGLSESRAYGARRSDRVLAATLCPCASFDGDHEDWCPSIPR